VSESGIKQIESDVLEGLPDLCRTFTGIADYLSLWCQLYGLRERSIRCGPLQWKDDHTLTFRITDRRGQAVSPERYDPRLPTIDKVFVARHERIRRFIGMSPWYRLQLKLVDREAKAYLAAYGLEPLDVETTNRWTTDGVIVIRFIWKDTPATRRRYLTHLKYGDERA